MTVKEQLLKQREQRGGALSFQIEADGQHCVQYKNSAKNQHGSAVVHAIGLGASEEEAAESCMLMLEMLEVYVG